MKVGTENNMTLIGEDMALIHGFQLINKAWLDKYPQVKIVGSPATGVDHIDLEALGRRGVKFVSLQGERKFLNKITSTTEHTFGLILSLLRHYDQALDGKRVMGHKLAGKTIGVIGHKGRIGKQMVRIAKAFGMKVLKADKGDKLISLLTKSDIVTVHIPLAGNVGFLKYSLFARMKKSAFFINTSRPGIVAKGHLLRALKDKLIQGAAVDFTDDPSLVKYAKRNKNLILTPHIGGFTEEDRALTDEFIIGKMQELQKPGIWPKIKRFLLKDRKKHV